MRTLCFCAALAAGTLAVAAPPAARIDHTNSAGARAGVSDPVGAYLHMPLSFEANQGQAPSTYAFVAHGPAYTLGISRSGLALTLSSQAGKSKASGSVAKTLSLAPRDAARLELRFAGSAGGSQLTGLDAQPGRSNYFIGNDPSQWRRNVPHFNRVQVSDVYPGIDVVLYGNQEQLEYDFAVAPGADPSRIQLQASAAQSVSVDRSGNAVLRTEAGTVELLRPVAFQEIAGARHPVESAFQLTDGKALRFTLGSYDSAHTLIIDPVLTYSVGFGGTNGNQGLGLAVDSLGNAYVTGNSCSSDFPTPAGNFPYVSLTGGAPKCTEAFVTKLDSTASSVIFSDFIGGTNGESTGTHVAVDSAQDVFVGGATTAVNFPVVSNIGKTAPSACGLTKSGYNCPDGFIAKLSPDGSQLLFASLLGGDQASGAFQVKLNPVSGDLTVLGVTDSSDFQPAPTTLETSFAGGSCTGGNACFNSFLLGLDPLTGKLRYGTFLGGAGNDWGVGLAFDASGNIFVAGSAQPPFSTSIGTATHTYVPGGGATAAGTNLFVAKLNLSGTTLTPGYLTLVQGDADTAASTIAVDGSGNAYFGGATAAKHLGVTSGVFQSANNSTFGNDCLWSSAVTSFLPAACGTGLVGKLDATGALSFLTYLGGSGQDEVQALGLDSTGNIWITGVTASSDFPVSSDHYGPNTQGFDQPFLAEMSNDGTRLPFGTTLGGSFGQSTDLFVDGGNNVYITGFDSVVTSTPGVYPDNPDVFSPVLLQKWSPGTAPSISVSTQNVNFIDTPLGGASAPQTVTIQNTGSGAAELGILLDPIFLGSETNDFIETTNCGSSLAGGASCTITLVFQPGAPDPSCVALPGCDPSSRAASLLIATNAIAGPQTVHITGTAAIGASLVVSPNPIAFADQAAGTSSTPLYVSAENTGDSGLLVTSIALSGPNAADFQLTLTGVGGFNCIPGPLPPGSYCALDVTFSPSASATGTRTATLTFTDSAGDSPQSVSVTGTVAGANDLTLSPLTLSPLFPVAIGTSQTAVLTVQNPTANSIQVTSLAVSGTNQGDFALAPSSCLTGGNPTLPITVPANGTCSITMTFNPAAGASGTRTATLTVGTSPAISGLPTVTLQGDAVTNSQPGMSFFQVPNPLNFGGLQVGETSNNASVLLTVNNNFPIPCAGGASTCGAPLVINSITPGLSDYTVQNQAPGCGPFPATIPSGSSCIYAIVFTPTAAGSRNTNLTIQSNDPQGAVQLPVYGSGLSLPLGEFLQTALNFGNSAIGVASPPLTATIKNAGLSNLTISNVTASTNFAVSANTCTTSPLAPNATCTISVTFTPPAAGFSTGTLTISDNGGFSQQQTVTLTGTGATGPQLRIMPPLVAFPKQTLDTTSAPLTVTLTSTGDSNIAFPGNAITTSQDFILQSSTCSGTLAPGSSCTASIQFMPTNVALAGFQEQGTMLVTDNATGSPQQVYLQGTGVQGTIAASTTTLASSANPSASGQSLTFTATVTGPSGNTTIPTGSVNFIDGSNTIGSGTLNASGIATYSTSSLSAGSHSITASYGGDGNFSGSTSPVLTQVVNGGTQLASTTTVTSSQNPSATGQAVTFTATVAGPTGSSVVPTGSVSFLDGTTTLGTGTLNGIAQATYSTSSLAAGSHSITAKYAGDTSFGGSTSSVLTQTVSASGFTIVVNPTSITVKAGASGTASVTVTPSGGFGQQVSFACSRLPAASTCSFSPSTVTTTGGNAATTTVTIATNVASAQLNPPLVPRGHPEKLATLLAMLFGVGGLWSARRKVKTFFCALMLIFGLAAFISGCGDGGGGNNGGGGGGGSSSNTPAGTSTLTITATGGSMSQTATLTLVVQ